MNGLKNIGKKPPMETSNKVNAVKKPLIYIIVSGDSKFYLLLKILK